MSKTATTLIGIGARPVGDDLETKGAEHTARLTTELGDWVRKQIPPILTDAEFAAISAGLLIAMSRKIAECAVAFGETHKVDPEQVVILISTMVQQNYATALAVSRGLKETVQ